MQSMIACMHACMYRWHDGGCAYLELARQILRAIDRLWAAHEVCAKAIEVARLGHIRPLHSQYAPISATVMLSEGLMNCCLLHDSGCG